MRSILIASFFAAVAALVVVARPTLTVAQVKPAEKKAPPNYDPPKVQKPDDATLERIEHKTEELRQAIAALEEQKLADHVLIEVLVYLKAAENIVRFDEWYAAESGPWALDTLDQGLARAKQAASGQTTWDAPGQWVVRAYRSAVDGSIQPYAVLLPHDYGQDPKRKWRLDIVLHGRDSALTEAKFIATHRGEAPPDLGFVQLEVYGRGNNAYRWAGEADVFEAAAWFQFGPPQLGRRLPGPIDRDRIVLRGFSMGGAGTWHIGLHHPSKFCVIGPGAGFTTTHGYVANLPEKLPDYVEKCLHIYDAIDYAQNAFNVPVVAYSGEKDAQKQAADNIQAALAEFPEPLRFTHLIAPGLEHQMPREWQDKAEVEYRKFADAGHKKPERVRFVTYTPKYGVCDWVRIDALGTTFDRALVDGTRQGNTFDVTTSNVRRMTLWLDGQSDPLKVTIDSQPVDAATVQPEMAVLVQVERWDGKWTLIGDRRELDRRLKQKPEKLAGLQGPIDDAFTSEFIVIKPTGAGFHEQTDQFASAAVDQFARLWDKYFRGTLPIQPLSAVNPESIVPQNVVLFGDPQSNPLIAHVLPKLPITWTKDQLVVNGVEYDAKRHVPVLIYPNPIDPRHYLVLNRGHTFQEADLRGTNALLFPRLGDWAVIEPTPTADDPAAYKVVAAGLFDENWQFANQK